ncbi:polysaccharide pyruvyl transferase CsaB [Hartmannibacter diazotrophicus]|uniref:Polysaccharide pyruvyl transferase CsaB n=1 Tax=Hartmannibacter diazotrophicus TaxID=1482074 RepID=A0A2C9D5I0_9HYPH|nr:polysaccharide pyruvyl transferase family protein [Hartmannibacter diazotrophicus]SON54765.1 polysaccharide pyruvyl transferase CsaB [Hartmannibacter diazotrophicus]
MKSEDFCPRVAIINQHGNNYGDDIACYAAVEQVRNIFRDAEITLIFNNPNEVILGAQPIVIENVQQIDDILFKKSDIIALLLDVFGLRMFGGLLKSSGMKRFEREIEKNDVVIVSPGGQNIGKYKDWWYLMQVLSSINGGKSPIFFLNTIARSGNALFDWLARFCLKNSEVFVRQKDSYDYVKSVGASVSLGVDTAFSFLPRHGELGPVERLNEIVFIPTNLSKFFRGFNAETVEGVVSDIADTLSSESVPQAFRIRIVPHLHSSSAESDFLNQIKLKIEKNGREVVVDHDVRTFFDYSDRIAAARVVISMRYHGVVLSGVHRTPFVGVAYEEKMQYAAAYLGQSDFSIPVSKWSGDAFKSAVEKVLEKELNIRDEIGGKLPLLRRLSRLPVDFLAIKYAVEDVGK